MSAFLDDERIKTVSEFAAICNEFLIYPALALEDERLREILKRGVSAGELRQYLTANF